MLSSPDVSVAGSIILMYILLKYLSDVLKFLPLKLHWFQWEPHSILPEHFEKFLMSCLAPPGHIKI